MANQKYILLENKKITQKDIDKALLSFGNSLLNKKYKHLWNENNVTAGYCYIVSEVLYHYANGNVKSFCISMEDKTTHWFVEVNGEKFDFTASQFKNEKIPYENSVGKGFFKGSIKTEKGFISKRAHLLYLKIMEIKSSETDFQNVNY